MKTQTKEKKLHKMFVYGTLVTESTRAMLNVEAKNIQNATLDGYRKEGLNVIKTDNRKVPGIIFDVDNRELARLDRYEGLDHGMYHRLLLDVEVGGKKQKAYVYQLTYTDEPVLK